MSEVHRVIAQMQAPSEISSGQVAEGFYVLSGNVLTMTYEDGSPVDPELYRHELKAGDKADAVARMLTKKVRLALLGISETEEKFARPIVYPALGVV